MRAASTLDAEAAILALQRPVSALNSPRMDSGGRRVKPEPRRRPTALTVAGIPRWHCGYIPASQYTIQPEARRGDCSFLPFFERPNRIFFIECLKHNRWAGG